MATMNLQCICFERSRRCSEPISKLTSFETEVKVAKGDAFRQKKSSFLTLFLLFGLQWLSSLVPLPPEFERGFLERSSNVSARISENLKKKTWTDYIQWVKGLNLTIMVNGSPRVLKRRRFLAI